MSKKQFGTNVYWGDGLAPVDCQYKIKCNLSRPAFRRFLSEIKRDGIYYNDGKEDGKFYVVVAFESKLQRDMHSAVLEAQAKNGGVFIKSK